jgi:hypothetical protein
MNKFVFFPIEFWATIKQPMQNSSLSANTPSPVADPQSCRVEIGK